MFFLPIIVSGTLALKAAAFDNTRFDNVAVYWGQNSYGAVNPSNTANWQQRLSFYCNDNAVDVFPLAFMNVFFGTGGLPSINLANTCNPTDNATFPGTELPNCSSLATDITTCQAKGKIITLSLGGATGAVGFSSSAQATSFAQTVWNLFLGGSSSTRPFGSAVLDGVDLDIEGGGSAYYDSFVNEIRSLAAGASKSMHHYYVTAAPQCVFPDANVGAVLNAANFDAVYEALIYDDDGRDDWARTTSPNKMLNSIAVQMRKSFPSFGGVMLWDESQAYANNRFDLAIKNALTAAGGTGFTYPACTASAWVAGTSYTAGSQANYYATDQPANNPGGDWSAISACGGASSSSVPTTAKTSTTISSSTTKSSTTTKSTTTSSSASPTATPGSGSCAGVASWSSGVAYQGGAQVVYNSHLWTAKWWSENDTPGGSAGDWTDDGPCTSANAPKAAIPQVKETALPSSIIKSRFFRL
ncbi:glycoside hydrolase superfamily [Gymnopilus junonius]|uniref:chitinase n=1 Tax=Gymnopilus junonius TaxID=109634 RepID=A0A9P5TJE4_GYMJU|nr:glycoside hydrolase superfamily [Gymnopilus junonius]